jgi:hypothetical protein
MSKVSIEEVIESLQRVAKLDPKVLIAVENDLEKKVEEIAADKEPGTKTRNQHVIVLLDPEGHVKGDVTGYVTQFPADQDAGTALDKLHKAAYEFNASPKRKGQAITNLGDIGRAKRRHFKDSGIKLVGGKEPLRVLVSRGPIPTT